METAGLDTSYLGILLEDKGDYLTGNSMGGHIILFQHQTVGSCWPINIKQQPRQNEGKPVFFLFCPSDPRAKKDCWYLSLLENDSTKTSKVHRRKQRGNILLKTNGRQRDEEDAQL